MLLLSPGRFASHFDGGRNCLILMMIWSWRQQWNGGAHAIVTFNQRDFLPAVKKFECNVVLPATALEKMRSLIP